jgi:GAF domain-containing protein
MSSASIVLDTRFFAQVEDAARWEERFDLLVSELREEYGPCFDWSSSSASNEVDIVFVLYPPAHHQRVVADRVLEDYISTRVGQLAQVHVIVIGRNSKDAKVQTSDVIDLVNAQCLPHGMKADATRVLRPEDLDDAVRTTLVRLFTRRQGGSPRPPDELPLAENSGVTNPSYSPSPPYESSDL